MPSAKQQSTINIWRIATLALLLSGCQSENQRQQQQTPATTGEMQNYANQQCATPPTGMSAQECRYYSQMQYGIQRNFYDADRYAGRECLVTISWGPQGHYKVLNASGDEVLCKKAWGVVSSAENLPPPPKNLPGQFSINFRPAD